MILYFSVYLLNKIMSDINNIMGFLIVKHAIYAIMLIKIVSFKIHRLPFGSSNQRPMQFFVASSTFQIIFRPDATVMTSMTRYLKIFCRFKNRANYINTVIAHFMKENLDARCSNLLYDSSKCIIHHQQFGVLSMVWSQRFRWWWYWEVPSMQIRIITFIPLLSTLLDVR